MKKEKHRHKKSLNNSNQYKDENTQMDRLTTISASFFMAADIFAIISLATPDWIVTDVGGKLIHNTLDINIYTI